MNVIATMVGSGVVLAAGCYLLALGGGALVRPDRTKRFLGGLAGSARIHFTELALRVVSGCALVLTAPRLAFGPALAIFGWILIGSSLALALLPWRLHHRFAAWSVPQATQHMPLIGAASIAGGLFLIGALLLPRLAG
ncbi:MAG: hypothetical protein ABIR59_03640 [Gemmatimonadales bacterium]